MDYDSFLLRKLLKESCFFFETFTLKSKSLGIGLGLGPISWSRSRTRSRFRNILGLGIGIGLGLDVARVSVSSRTTKRWSGQSLAHSIAVVLYNVLVFLCEQQQERASYS